MKYERSERFKAEFRRLTSREQLLFLDAVREINDAYERRGALPLPVWPSRLRISQLAGHPGVYEVTWSYAGPDGRATFEYVDIGGETGIRWRRIGGHEVFRDP